MTKLRVINDSPLNPRARVARHTTIKQMDCYGCREPNAVIEAYELTANRRDDGVVNYSFRERTDACEPVMRAIYGVIEAQRTAAENANNRFGDNTVLQMTIRPPQDRPERLNARRLPVIGRAAEYLHDRFLYNRGQCEVEFIRRYEPQAAQAQPVPPAAAPVERAVDRRH